jgi:hypothetical protein
MDDLDERLCAGRDTTTPNDTVALFIRVIINVVAWLLQACLSTVFLARYFIHEGGGNAKRTRELRD